VSLLKVRLSEAWNWGGLSFRELAARTWDAIQKHDTLNRAAVVAFYAMLSLVPMLGLILAAGLSTHSRVASEVLDLSARFLPAEADSVVRDQVQKIQSEAHIGLLSLSAAILLWSASSLFVAVMDTTNAAYAVQDSRPWWKRRFMALILTLAEVTLLVIASVLALAWPALTDRIKLQELAWLTSAGAVVVQWAIVVLALLTAFALAYYFGPDVKQKWEWITPGAVLGVLVLVGASLGFQFYLRFGSSYSETYGALAGVVLMMLWLYLAAVALLVGAEVNSVIEHAAPHGRQPGQKVGPECR
jgi:membrane protein